MRSQAPCFGRLSEPRLEASADGAAPLVELAPQYFNAHADLRKNELLSFDQTTAVLGHARLIAYLGDSERLSASQIARILRPLDERLDIPWQAVERVLRKMKLYRPLDQETVDAVWEQHQAAEAALFGDAGVRSAPAALVRVGRTVECRGRRGPSRRAAG